MAEEYITSFKLYHQRVCGEGAGGSKVIPHSMGNYTRNRENNKDVRPLQTEEARNLKIREQYATGSYSYRKLARIYHVSYQRIAEIVHGTPAPQEEAAIHE